MADTAIEWTANPDGSPGKVWNPTTGCDKISAGCDNCLTPDTRVLRADMVWVSIADINVGDRVLSFTDEPAIGQNRVWEEATVLAKWETEKPTVEFDLANGTSITASEDHRWLIAKRGKDKWWRKTVDLNFKTEVRTVRCEPTDIDCPDYWAGYVAGATAGDGTFRWRDAEPGQQVYWRVAKPVRDQVVLDRLVQFLGALGVEVHVRPFDSGTSAFTDKPIPMAKVETRRATNLEAIADLCVERSTREWLAGWLAGMFDTDASYTGGNLRYCQSKPNDVLDRVVRYGKELDFDLRREDWENNCPTVRLHGGIAENIAFLSAISPVMPHRLRDFYGKRVEAVDVTVTGIRRGPARTLIDITTSTGTFIAEGALTHNCYALKMAKRLKGMGSAKYQTDGDPRTSGPGFGLAIHPDALSVPLGWRKPERIFVNSMSDLFHAKVPLPFVQQVFDVMEKTPQHIYMVLTKRGSRLPRVADKLTWPANLWMGVSVENADHLDRIDDLRQVPAAVRFVSAEPLIGALDDIDLTGISWLIAGGESGKGARPMELDWVRSLVDLCDAAGTAPFVKQLGSVWARQAGADSKGGDWNYWPDDLRVRRYPGDRVAVA